jgi:hypothetical protein
MEKVLVTGGASGLRRIIAESLWSGETFYYHARSGRYDRLSCLGCCTQRYRAGDLGVQRTSVGKLGQTGLYETRHS